MTAAPARCPYCGSIENHGNLCDWCHNTISDDYYINESEDKKMKIKLEFTDLDPAQALELIRLATRGAEEHAADPAPVLPAPAPVLPAPAPVLPAPTTVPPAPSVPVQPIPTAVPFQPPAAAAPAAPTATPAAAPIPTVVKQYTADELALAARPVCEMPGGREKLLDLLHSFTYTDSTGTVRTVQSLMDMPPEQYPALANGIRQLGGRI